MELRTITDAYEATARTTAFYRALWCKAEAEKQRAGAHQAQFLFQNAWGADGVTRDYTADALRLLAVDGPLFHKAAVLPGTDSSWAQALASRSALVDTFSRAVSRGFAWTRMGASRIPFVTSTPIGSSGGSGTISGVAEGAPKPATALAFTNAYLTAHKTARIVVVSGELAQLTATGSVLVLDRLLTAALIRAVDGQVFDAAAASPARPAGILNGVTATAAPAGNSAADAMAAALAALAASRPETDKPSIVTSQAIATRLPLDPGSDISTGRVLCHGVPVVLVASVHPKLIALDASALVYAQTDPQIDVSTQASVQLDDAPDNPATAATVLRSLWQDNLIAYKPEVFCNWLILAGAVQFIADASAPAGV